MDLAAGRAVVLAEGAFGEEVEIEHQMKTNEANEGKCAGHVVVPSGRSGAFGKWMVSTKKLNEEMEKSNITIRLFQHSLELCLAGRSECFCLDTLVLMLRHRNFELFVGLI